MIIKLSVRNLVENTMMSGSITSLGFGSAKNVEGIKGHKIIQSNWGDGYTPEVPVSITVPFEEFTLEISGRIDGVYKDAGRVVIEEIKTTSMPLEYLSEDYNPLHLAQGKIYAYIYAATNNVQAADVKLTYFNRESRQVAQFTRNFTFSELKSFFDDTVNEYKAWAEIMYSWPKIRNISVKTAGFPFERFRQGQRSLTGEVYKALRDGRRLFAQAPTGTGKTVAALFPAIKALEQGYCSKIFYLTAKTITRTVAENTLDIMYSRGLRLKSITLTAKEKICFCPEICCVPEECDYAKGYYDRIKSSIKSIFDKDRWDRKTIEEFAIRHKVCPFEFSLDLSLWADVIICDYNYVFDPRVQLKRFFYDTRADYSFLIDEAHNLVERGREMFSASLCKSSFLNLSKKTKTSEMGLTRCLKEINRCFIKLKNLLNDEDKKYLVADFEPLASELMQPLNKFIGSAQSWLEKNRQAEFKDELIDLYFDCLAFVNTSEIYDERFATYINKEGGDIAIRLYCLDPSHLLRNCLDKGSGSVFFSATLTPLDYYRDLLGGDTEDEAIMLHSPFPEENLRILIAGEVSTRFVNRSKSFDLVADYINAVASLKKGNYIAYFPSYKYLNDVYERFLCKYPEVDAIVQNMGMSEDERMAFLDRFSELNESTLVGFAVMGGVFGEGIDLFGDKLSGAAIVGVGLPQICVERDIIRDYFQKTNSKGFEYAYMYPGMNKVMQASGRVIRTETDKGIVLLIDERFANENYRKLFPRHWQNAVYIKSPGTVLSMGRFS